jgi:hypothetical protein
LHLCHKLQYFKDAGEWITQAKQIVCDEFDRSYASLDADWAAPLPQIMQTQALKSQNMFDNLPSLRAPEASKLCDELERFLSTDPKYIEDVLLWWYEHRHVYPRLHRMALDHLTISGRILLLSAVLY